MLALLIHWMLNIACPIDMPTATVHFINSNQCKAPEGYQPIDLIQMDINHPTIYIFTAIAAINELLRGYQPIDLFNRSVPMINLEPLSMDFGF